MLQSLGRSNIPLVVRSHSFILGGYFLIDFRVEFVAHYCEMLMDLLHSGLLQLMRLSEPAVELSAHRSEVVMVFFHGASNLIETFVLG